MACLPYRALWDIVGEQAEVKDLFHGQISNPHWSREAMQMVAFKDGTILRFAKMVGIHQPHQH